MGAVAASGGYYIALGGRKIFASPGTLTASIGVIMEFANTDKLYKWAKIDRYSLKSGKFKDLGTTTRFMTTDEKGLIDELISDIHNQFKSALRERRGLEESILERVTDGRIMTGLQAKQAKLIDEIGGLDVVIEALKKEVGLPVDAYVKYPESKHGFLWRLFFGEARERLSVNPVSDWFQRSKPIWGWRVLLLSPIQY